MSNSVLNNKFKKWSSLLAQNPDNVDYKNKVSKYGTLMVRAVQGGGSGNGNGEVDDLLRKIDGVVRKNNMNGGGKQVTGYRNMRGGNGLKDVAKISGDIDTLQTKIQEQAIAYNKLVEEFTPIIEQLINKLEEEKKKVVLQAEQIAKAQADVEQAAAQVAASGSEKDAEHARALSELQNQLTAAQSDASQKAVALEAKITELKAKVEEVVKETNTVKSTSVKDALITRANEVLGINVVSAAAAQPGGSRRTTRRH